MTGFRSLTGPALLTGAAAVALAAAPAPPARDEQPQQAGPRVLVYHDMEGLSGQDDWRTFDFDFPEHYARGRELLIGDVNAVIAGLFAGGAGRVDLVDAHGSGNPEPDVPGARLDPRVRQVFRDTPFRQYVDLVEPNTYDAIVAVGMHAKTGSGGFASHTFDAGIAFSLEGREITETELIGFSWGRVGVPVILITGDDRLRADLSTMPWIEYVQVKRATSAGTAELRPVAEVHEEMRRRAADAVRNLRRMRPMTLPARPLRAGVRAVAPASLFVLRDVPGVRYRDGAVEFEAADFAAAYDGWIGLYRVAIASHRDLLFEAVRARPDGAALLHEYGTRVVERWMDFESGRWSAPAPAPAPAGRRYFGAR